MALAGLALALPSGLATAQELRSGSALAGIEWPVSAYDWSDDAGGPRQALLEQGAANLGGYCGSTREFNVWNLEGEEEPEQFGASILSSFEAAGWTLTPAAVPGPTVYLATRQAERLAIWFNDIPGETALGLFGCALQTEPATADAVTDAAAAARRAKNVASELPVVGGLGLGALALGAGILLIGLWQRRRAGAAAGWQEVPALIADSQVRKTSRTNANDDEFTEYTPIIRYSYRFAGVEYESKRLRFGASGTGEQKDADAIAAQYKVGTTVMARVNPARPSEATLLIERPRIARFAVPSAIFAILGVVLLVVAQNWSG